MTCSKQQPQDGTQPLTALPQLLLHLQSVALVAPKDVLWLYPEIYNALFGNSWEDALLA